MTEAEEAYLAGIIDGEGSIMAYSCRWVARNGRREDWIQLRVDIANTDRRLIDWLAARWRGTTRTQQRPPGQKPTHYFTASNLAVAPLLEAALPYLVLKREQAELALELIASKRNHGRRGYPAEEKARRVALADRVSELNRKGTLPRGKPRRAA